MSISEALSRVSAERAANLTLDLVSIPSPTGDTAEVARRFAAELRSLDLEVDLFLEYPKTPVVIGRLRGSPGGKTLVLNGHLDTVPVPHPAPERRDGRVYGRGAADMKGPVAAAVEAVRAVREAGERPAGDVVLCAHGLHEAPGGAGEDLAAALRAGAVRGDAAIVLELGHSSLPVVQLGMFIYRAVFQREGGVGHELRTSPGTPNPLFAAAEAALALQELDRRLSTVPIEHTGPESVFAGQIHCGDFYNRFPATAWIEGTRRYAPEKAVETVEEELRGLLAPIAARWGLNLDLQFRRVRGGCRIAEDHPLVAALRSAYRDETGRELPVSGSRTVADAPLFHDAGIPCLYHGLAGEGAHGDLEYVPEEELGRGARTYLRTIFNYLGHGA